MSSRSLVSFFHVSINLEAAKLHALRAKNVLKCQRVLRADVITCLACLLAHVSTCLPCVFTCSRVNVVCMLTRSHDLSAHVPMCRACSRAYVPKCLECLRVSSVNTPCVLTYLCVNMVWVSYLTWLLWPHYHLPTCLACLVSSFDPNFFSFTAIVIEVVHTVGKV